MKNGNRFHALHAHNCKLNSADHVAANHPKVADVLVTCYKIGIGNGSAACMNDLGALYYMGDIVEQPAIRIANIIMEDDCESYGVERDSPRHC